jgi:hypothetical protein
MEKAKLIPMPPGIHAGKLHDEAQSYVEAPRKLADDPQRFIGPRYFLLCHGLELALKSFLAAKGDRNEVLVNLGHDLNKAYDRARVERASISMWLSRTPVFASA